MLIIILDMYVDMRVKVYIKTQPIVAKAIEERTLRKSYVKITILSFILWMLVTSAG